MVMPQAQPPVADPLSEMGLAPPPMQPAMRSPMPMSGSPLGGAAPQNPGVVAPGPAAAVAGQPGVAPAPAPTIAPPLPSQMPDYHMHMEPGMKAAVDQDLRKDFTQRHGREPTSLEMSTIYALPLIEQNLGRPPTRMEILSYLGARQENPPPSAAQFEAEPPTV